MIIKVETKKKFFYPFKLCKMMTNKTKKIYIKGTGARDTKTFDKMQVINKTLTFGKFGPIGGVLRLRGYCV